MRRDADSRIPEAASAATGSASATPLAQAVAAWRDAIGAAHVITDGPQRLAAETATFATTQRVPAIVRPGNRAEVQACLRIATQHGAPVYPISGGKNWGYGSRVPAGGDQTILDLSRLNRIVDFDEKLAYVTVEPGATFGQVERFLRARGSDLMLGSPGSTPDASVVGNAVERGIANGPDGDRAAQVCGLEVALPDGSLIETGLARFGNAAAARVFVNGPGPSPDGLFFQSNLGVVTRLTHWLTPRPAFQQYCAFAINRSDRLPALIDALQAIKREGLLETNIALHNALKILTYGGRFPSERSQDEALDLAGLPAGYGELLDGGVWFGETAVTAQSEAIGIAKRERLGAMLDGVVDRLIFHAPAERNAMLGSDGASSLASVYWRKTAMPDLPDDPDRDHCGLIWLCPIAPFDGATIARCISLIEQGLIAFGFEPIIGLQCHSLRAVHVVASIVYDRDRPGHDARAVACHDNVLEKLIAAGFVPYRLASLAMRALLQPAGAWAHLLATVKAAVDPAAILAPGRYPAGRR